MTKFNYLSNICGCDKPFVARIRLIENIDVDKGDIVYYDETKLSVTPKKGNLTIVAGVCAEKYEAKSNDLVPSYGCGEISVIISPDALYYTAPFVITDSGECRNGGISTNVTKTQIDESTGLVGSKLVLVSKTHDSQNPSQIGSVHTITNVTLTNGFVSFGTDTGTISAKGDKYIFVPTYGFELLDRDTDGNLFVNYSQKGTFTVMAASEKGYVLKLCGMR